MIHKFASFSKEYRFNELCKTVHLCRLCQRLTARNKVLSLNNGNINAKVLFIAEAPGRLGADRTGIPLHGDRSGDIFESLIGNIGWHRKHIFITNAVLCNPRIENGNNDKPTKNEIMNCSLYLEMTIALIQPDIIVPLGHIALDALSLIHPHSLKLRDNVAKLSAWHGKYVFPLYHPAPRALIHRNLTKQRSDYMHLVKVVDPIKGMKSQRINNTIKLFKYLDDNIKRPITDMVLIILSQLNELSMFKLMKLLYLADLTALTKLGKSLSGEIYLRQNEGPWIPSLKDTLNSIKDNYMVITSYKMNKPYIKVGPNYRFETSFDEVALDIISDVIEKYGTLSDARIKTMVYLTMLMKYILKQEKAGRTMYNKPVIYNDKFSYDL